MYLLYSLNFVVPYESLTLPDVDGKDPEILEDKEYPEWLFSLADPVSCIHIDISHR